MSLEEILSRIKPLREELMRMGVARLVVFGPPVQQGFIRKRELDLIYQPSEPVTFEAYRHLKKFLEEILQCRVDLAIADLEQAEVDPYVDKLAVRVI